MHSNDAGSSEDAKLKVGSFVNPVGPLEIVVSGTRVSVPKLMNRFTEEPMFQWSANHSPGSGTESKYVFQAQS